MTLKSFLRPFVPIFKNPHLLTIAGNYWHRKVDTLRFPVEEKLFETEPGVQILVHSQRPENPHSQLILVHGLEGSSAAGYAQSLAQAALEGGYAVHRFNMRSCGGTEAVCGKTLYHSGQTSDVLALAKDLRKHNPLPIFLIGFSLGGNVVLKLAGEMGKSASEVIAGVCAVSTPIDLAACVERLKLLQNRIYANRFLKRLKQRIRLKERLTPGLFDLSRLANLSTPSTLSTTPTPRPHSVSALRTITTPRSPPSVFLIPSASPRCSIQAKDDPLIPFDIYQQPAFATNPHLQLIAPDHGGHLGFISRHKPRFWLDTILLEWLQVTRNKLQASVVS